MERASRGAAITDLDQGVGSVSASLRESIDYILQNVYRATRAVRLKL